MLSIFCSDTKQILQIFGNVQVSRCPWVETVGSTTGSVLVDEIAIVRVLALDRHMRHATQVVHAIKLMLSFVVARLATRKEIRGPAIARIPRIVDERLIVGEVGEFVVLCVLDSEESVGKFIAHARV